MPLETLRVGPTCRLLVRVLAAPVLEPGFGLVLELGPSPVDLLPLPVCGVVVVPLPPLLLVPPLPLPVPVPLPELPLPELVREPLPEPVVEPPLDPEPLCEPVPGWLPPPWCVPPGAGPLEGGGVLCPPVRPDGELGACVCAGAGRLGAVKTGATTGGPP